ncbi:unnamed protein product [Urochloa humidicola]
MSESEVEAEAEAEVEPRAPTWAEAQAMERRLRWFRQMIGDLNIKIRDEKFFSGLSDESQEAKHAKAEEDLLSLTRQYMLLSSQMKDPDLSRMSEADRAATAEDLRFQAREEARILKEQGDLKGGKWREGEVRILDFDPKQRGGIYFNRCPTVYLPTFDHDEESSFGPMRHTDAIYHKNQTVKLHGAVNILSVKVACSDVGYPIKVYGTVIARDSIDHRCVYLFRRDRDHCQLIKSKDHPLILTGPKRGLAFLDDNFVEIDLKIKDRQGQDRELSKGVICIKCTGRPSEKCKVESKSLATRLGTVDVMYAAVKGAVEATIAVEVLEGEFVGKITAHTTSMKKCLVLYDSKVAGAVTGDGHRVMQLMRPAVSVHVKDMLAIVAKTGDGESVRIIAFTTRVKGRDEDIINVGATKMSVKVAWSIMDP